MAEILVVVAIIAVILLAVLPSFGDFQRSWKVRSAADEMLSALRGVRQMAITMRGDPNNPSIQGLIMTFTPAPANTYSYFHPIKKKTLTIKLPPHISMTTNPSGSYAPAFKINGSITNPSAPDTTSPTSNYVEISSIINGSRTDRYRFGFASAGQVIYTVTH